MRSNSLPLAVCLAVAANFSAFGAFVSPSADPFYLPNAGFGIPNAPPVCFPTVCFADNVSSNYQYVSKTFVYDSNTGKTNEYADTTATFQGVVEDASGNFLTNYSATGHVNFEFLGRDSDTSSLTPWDALITRDDFTVSVSGTNYTHFFHLELDPSQPTTGTLSVIQQQSSGDLAFGGNQQSFSLNLNDSYLIDMNFTVYAKFTADPEQQGGFTGVPGSYGLGLIDTTATPEPGTWGLLAAGIAGIAARLKRRR